MLKLIQTDWGVFDLAPNDPALDDFVADITSLIYASLFTDAEAPDSLVSDPYDRRGWWADSGAGSGLWYVRRQGLSTAARNECITIIKRTLAAHDEALQNIQVETLPLNTSAIPIAGNSSSVTLLITGLHNGQKFIVRASL